MIWTKLRLSDKVHFFVEKLTCVTAPNREPVAGDYKEVRILMSQGTNDILSLYATPRGVVPKASTSKSYQKSDLCAILVTGYYKAWQLKENDAGWQANEAQQLRKICIENINEMRKKTKETLGSQKITKQMMFSAILHRVVSTQDVKEFFSKML